jgi:hypothetical protein
MSGFVWYSFGSDKTGPILAKALGFDAGKKTPELSAYNIIVGWGCKTGTKYNPEQLAQLIANSGLRVLNHPDSVMSNRDKLGTLKRLQEAGIPVPGFLEFGEGNPVSNTRDLLSKGLENGLISLPLILLRRGNAGEPIFCYTLEDAEAALRKKADKKASSLCYARSYLHADEWRIHVFRDKIISAQQKRCADDPLSAAIDGLTEKLQKRAKRDKVDVKLGSTTARYIITNMAGDMLANSSQLKKSVKMGWEWVDRKLAVVPKQMVALAIEALDIAGLDMGAISISHCRDTDTMLVLSIHTAPGLTEEQTNLYVAEIEDFVTSDGKTKSKEEKRAATKRKNLAPELVARLYKRVKDLSPEKAEKLLKSLGE